ncbi:lycopene beta-cyclase CrtY [Pontixanthobacter aquaemixtae]|uniref:Lycopene beta-cyclase CrtY n=1 Tax=Pontixanthobacter aquaemixtae TaxID=1958940 RepID=A0A844ZYS0_9SPHN|nr:lycopene beta-cyclase CrtY [Pontixanthobacter aquaemixtae]MXO91887.1 lycopene beta-cyclase CrtY [Pontixanthobacter aquaemixtae]
MNGRAQQPTADTRTEIAIVGGGLSGGLIALALRKRHPEMRVLVIEAGETLGGNHRWSWFGSDLDEAGHALLAPFRKSEWQGYSVRFPAYERKLPSTYFSLTSQDFDAALRRELGADTLLTNRNVASLDSDGVTLADSSRISARTVIDCRGPEPSEHLTGGWQVFMGRHTRTAKPHGIDRPIIMDAAVEQLAPADDPRNGGGAYRFVYVLPLGANDLFIEDTYYADSPVLDRGALSGRIDRYSARHGWDGEILGGETGVLPVITGGNFAAFQASQRIDGVTLAGARGGFAHPLTSYTVPFAVQTALAIAEDALLPGQQLSALFQTRARRHWKQTKFYRRLGAMLFGAAKPDRRFVIFERFYRLPARLIERFYAGTSRLGDRARILIGRPPVSIIRAIGALGSKGAPLIAGKEKIG